ncbi:unnamed protein product [Pedinophyceae sp. YPF-701]|nr:unnamed protein product [Pedinophyceae sp. YPF-701]
MSASCAAVVRRSVQSCRAAPAPLRARAAARGVSTRSSVRVRAAGGDLKAEIKERNAANPVVVYSKTYCPFCTRVKSLLQEMGVKPIVIELDVIPDGDTVQATLAGVSGMRTVPQVFIGGELVGGCDDTVAAKTSGRLEGLLAAAGAI